MKKILLSIGIIAFAGFALAVGGTGAFFSDSETSTANTFAAGAIDLKIDNASYYNGATSPNTSWSLNDLTIEKFFNFLDLKPGDFGEDTISLHVDTNDAYLCANVKLTSNDDNGINEPEGLVDTTDGVGNGELAQNVNFIWWADDGDNVLENNESVISGGPIGAIPVGETVTLPLADSQNNIWTNQAGPVPGNQTLYIGKAWCFGAIEAAPLVQDNSGTTRNPSLDNNGSGGTATPEDGGYSCTGANLGNGTQTDSLTADVSFTAIQARNNPRYLCIPPKEEEKANLTVIKVVQNIHGGNNVVADFQLFADGAADIPMTSGISASVPVGVYSVSETGVSGYTATFSGDCDAEGNITLSNGDNKTCTITNTDLPANITLIKVVTVGPALPNSFKMRVDGTLVPNTTSIAVTSNAAHTITEDAKTDYHFVSITGNAKCPAALGGTATLNEGEAITCTITNTHN
ncbi:MAG: hypothetical protein RL641_585 [Candidatus Parcubacteria bacterium]|jgi:predicted ribosomally synthesized peptide with SipW-like signal peptide